MERDRDGVPCKARLCKHSMISKYGIDGCAYIDIKLDFHGRCTSYEFAKLPKKEFKAKAVNTIINPCLVVHESVNSNDMDDLDGI